MKKGGSHDRRITRHLKRDPLGRRILAGIATLFLLFDALGKFARPAPVVDAFVRLGIPVGLAPAIGALLLVLTIAYAIPRANVLGAILLTGYFGGAVAINLRAGSPGFEVFFPIIMGMLIWAPLYLTDDRLRALIPARR